MEVTVVCTCRACGFVFACDPHLVRSIIVPVANGGDGKTREPLCLSCAVLHGELHGYTPNIKEGAYIE